MNIRCVYESPCDGRLCKRWAMRGTNFCFHHQPRPGAHAVHDGASLHPLARLTTPEDVFDVLRETLNAARQGRISPGQAYAVGYLAQTLLKVRNEVSFFHRQEALYRQIIPTLVDEEGAAEMESDLAMPLPVKIDESAATDAPPPPRNAAEAEARHREIVARMPPIPPEELAEIKRLSAEITARAKAAKPNGSRAGGTTGL